MTWAIWQVVMLVIEGAASIALPACLIRRDERLLSPESRLHGFLPATFWVAVVAFGPLSLPVHFLRTRRSWAGLGLGLGWLVAASTILGLLDHALLLIPGIFGGS